MDLLEKMGFSLGVGNAQRYDSVFFNGRRLLAAELVIGRDRTKGTSG